VISWEAMADRSDFEESEEQRLGGAWILSRGAQVGSVIVPKMEAPSEAILEPSLVDSKTEGLHLS